MVVDGNTREAMTIEEYIAKAEADGLHIEAGLRSLLAATYPNGVGEEQYRDLRKFFFAGATHLFTKMLMVMDNDREPTENDMAFMARIQAEINTFTKTLHND